MGSVIRDPWVESFVSAGPQASMIRASAASRVWNPTVAFVFFGEWLVRQFPGLLPELPPDRILGIGTDLNNMNGSMHTIAPGALAFTDLVNAGPMSVSVQVPAFLLEVA